MNNKIIGNIKYENASIEFTGDNNTFICKDEVTLENCKIRFTGSNSLVYINKSDSSISLNIRIGNDSVIYIGKECHTNGPSYLYATERKNIIIGNQLLISFDTYLRTSDPNVIYDCFTKERVNFSESILIGDKVWIGQQSLILKGTIIGSGAIISGRSVVSNKLLESNTQYSGNPVQKVRENVFFASSKTAHDLDEEEELNTIEYEFGDNYFYEDDVDTISLEKIDVDLMDLKTVDEKVKYLEEHVVYNEAKNRFYHK